jgi:tetratricopeptide (TPR) repeat protein
MAISIVRGVRGIIAVIATALVTGCGGSDPEALLASGKEYLVKNDTKAAVIQFKNALQHNPKLAEARFLLGKTLLDSNDVAGAEKELRKALELNYPTEHVVPALARALVLLGQYKQVIQEFSKTEIGSRQSLPQRR